MKKIAGFIILISIFVLNVSSVSAQSATPFVRIPNFQINLVQSPSASPTASVAPSLNPSSSAVASSSVRPSVSVVPTPIASPSSSLRPTLSPSPTVTPAVTPTLSSSTPSPTARPTGTPTALGAATTPTPSPTPRATATPRPVVAQTQRAAENTYRNILVPALSFVTQTEAQEFYKDEALPPRTVIVLYVLSVFSIISGLYLMKGDYLTRLWSWIREGRYVRFANRV